jgi:ATP-binding cassette, subfamily B, bacterial MsbA
MIKMQTDLDKRYPGKELYLRILKYTKYYWIALIIGIVGNAAYSGIDATVTGMLKPILNKGFIARDYHFIIWLPFFVMGAFIFRAIFNFIGSYFMAYVSRSVVMRIRIDLFTHLLKIPAFYYDNSSSGQILSVLLYNVEQIAKVSATALTNFVQSFFLVAGLIGVMFYNSWQLSLIYLLTIPLIAIFVKISSKVVRKVSYGIQKGMGEITSIAEEAVSGYKVVRAFGGQSYESNKFKRAVKDNRKRELKNVILKAIGVSGVQLIAAFALAVIIYLATAKGATALSAGGFVAMLAAMLAILKPLKTLATVNNTIQRGLAGAQGVFAMLDDEVEKNNGTKILKNSKGLVEYKNLNFTYAGGDKEVLNDISFTIEPGKSYALVGRSGSGKSTLVNLLPRFYDYKHGEISIDGTPIKEYELDSLRSQIAIVSQHVILFNDTVAKNIAYGLSRDASDEAIIDAARAAHAWEFIEEFPDKLQTIVGENGVLLSGGQRQRLAIARAILRNSPILILDEATSALDTEAERHIQNALENLMENRTTIVIAHRLSTIEKADCILVMDHGKIIERGTHKELLAQKGHYANLHKMQFSQ